MTESDLQAYTLQVCDFGTSTIMEKSGGVIGGIGTVAYMAPEVMDTYSKSEPETVRLANSLCDSTNLLYSDNLHHPTSNHRSRQTSLNVTCSVSPSWHCMSPPVVHPTQDLTTSRFFSRSYIDNAENKVGSSFYLD